MREVRVGTVGVVVVGSDGDALGRVVGLIDSDLVHWVEVNRENKP